jgi:hypothetical protein
LLPAALGHRPSPDRTGNLMSWYLNNPLPELPSTDYRWWVSIANEVYHVAIQQRIESSNTWLTIVKSKVQYAHHLHNEADRLKRRLALKVIGVYNHKGERVD